jgi:hypothetical protein
VFGARASEHAARVEEVDRLAPSHSFALAHPLDDVCRLAAAQEVPDAVVEMQLQRRGAVEAAMGGQPSHVVKAGAGAGGLDGGDVPGRSRWQRRQAIAMGGAESNHGAMVRRPTHSNSHRTTHSSAHRRARGTQWKGLRAFGNSQQHSQQHSQDFSQQHSQIQVTAL